MEGLSPQTIGYLALVLMFVLLILRVPIAFVLIISGFLAYWAIRGIDPALAIVSVAPYTRIYSHTFTVIPLFIIMGHFAHHAGFVTDIFKSMRTWLGWLPGGLVHATVGGAAAFGAASGSGIASCAIVGKVTIPEMVRHGVDRKLAIGAVAASGTIAAMIPPSNLMIIFGIITETSISQLLIAGIIPGIIAALVYMVQIFIRVKINPSLAPRLEEKVTWKDRFVAVKGVWGIAVVAVIIMGGIYTGVFTPTEAGALGALATFIMALAMRRLSFSELGSVLVETTRTTGMIFLIFAFAAVFGYLLGVSRIPTTFAEFIAGLDLNRYWILMGLIVVYLILGMLVDSISQMILTMPIVFPAVVALGFNPIWFGVIMVHLMEMALITPPFALNIFVLKGVVEDATIGEIISGVLPYLISDFTTLTIYIVFPQVALWLPSLMWNPGVT